MIAHQSMGIKMEAIAMFGFGKVGEVGSQYLITGVWPHLLPQKTFDCLHNMPFGNILFLKMERHI
jgi:hypothetical protein